MTVGFNYLGKMGQLGNQMFQYAASLGVDRKNGEINIQGKGTFETRSGNSTFAICAIYER